MGVVPLTCLQCCMPLIIPIVASCMPNVGVRAHSDEEILLSEPSEDGGGEEHSDDVRKPSHGAYMSTT